MRSRCCLEFRALARAKGVPVVVVDASPDEAIREAMRAATTFFAERSGLSQGVLRRNLFMLAGEDASWHLLRVSAGLDSIVVGEGQILSQVKACYSHAIAPAVEPTEEGEGTVGGSAGKVLGRLLNRHVVSHVSVGRREVHNDRVGLRRAVSIGRPLREHEARWDGTDGRPRGRRTETG